MRRSWLRLFWAGVLVAAAVGGYLVSSGAGERLLHREIETQLGRLLRGPVAIERVRIRFEGGLRIEATGFAAYPAPDGSVPPALRARRVLADVDSLALLIGRLELSALRFEAPHLRIERGPDGALSHLPLPRLRRETPSAPAGNEAETLLQRLEAVDGGARALLGETQVARHIEIRDGTLHWLDHRAALADGAPLELRLELVQGMLDRDWLSGALRVEAEAVLVDGRHAPLPFEIGLRRDEAGHLEWSGAVARIPIETLGSRLGAASPTEGPSGTLAARLRLRRVAPDGPLRLDLAGRIRDAAFGPGFALSMLESETLDAAIGLELDAREVRLTEGLLSAGRLRLGFEASLDRPLRASSETRIESRLSGLELDELRAVARDLARDLGRDSSAARTLSRLATALEDGRIESIEATGRARLQRWQALLGGQTRELPSGLVLGSRFAGLSIVTESGDRFDGIRGEAQWAGDRLMLRKLNGSFQGRPLPELEAVIDGVSHLLSGMDETVLVSATPPPLPGLAPLLRLIEPRDADAPSPIRSVTFAFERLDHPLFRYPLRGLGIRVEPLRTGLQIAVREGRWGRAAIEGEVVFFDDPAAPSVTARLALAPSSPAVAAVSTASPDSGESGSARPAADAAPERWGVGHIELELRPGPRLPSRRATGFLRLEDGSLRLTEIEAALEPQGELAARAVLDLTRDEAVGIDLSFALTDARLGRLAPVVALPSDLAHGTIQASGSVRGSLRPDASPISELAGRIRAEARQGRVRMKLPLLLRLSRASEGYNPFADADELDYESMTATIGLDRGRLSTEDFELEGPLRVFATGRIDTRRTPVDIRAVVGIFLFRAPNQVLETLPLVRSFLPGSDRGLIGTYFDVKGPIAEPEVEALAMKTLMSGVPDAIKAPFKMLRLLFDRTGEDA